MHPVIFLCTSSLHRHSDRSPEVFLGPHLDLHGHRTTWLNSVQVVQQSQSTQTHGYSRPVELILRSARFPATLQSVTLASLAMSPMFRVAWSCCKGCMLNTCVWQCTVLVANSCHCCQIGEMGAVQVSSQRSPAVKREGSGATGGAGGAQRPAIADSSTSSGEPSINQLINQSINQPTHALHSFQHRSS